MQIFFCHADFVKNFLLKIYTLVHTHTHVHIRTFIHTFIHIWCGKLLQSNQIFLHLQMHTQSLDVCKLYAWVGICLKQI